MASTYYSSHTMNTFTQIINKLKYLQKLLKEIIGRNIQGVVVNTQKIDEVTVKDSSKNRNHSISLCFALISYSIIHIYQHVKNENLVQKTAGSGSVKQQGTQSFLLFE